MSSEWHEGHAIGWYATDLYKLGLIKTEEEWEELIDVMNDTAMQYFQDREKDV
jgi:hypothetical protein